ncbi:MAG: wax ester/triacylglycerol synthase domain-containing protein [Acidimicrobiales bacterium]|jgi:WS/DGAT/MGAT family acyltransferase
MGEPNDRFMGDGDRFLRDTDAFTWYLETDPGLRATIVSVAWLERSPDVEALTARLERATRLVPRFRQRLVQPLVRMATPRWVDTDFDLSLHFRRMDAPRPSTASTVLDFARAEAMTGFDRTRPLWQFTLIEHLNDDRAALVMKVHHALTDGIGGIQLVFLLFDTTRDPGPLDQVPVPEAVDRDPGAIGLVRESLARDWHRAFGTIRLGLADVVPAVVQVVREPLRSTSEVLATARSVARFIRPVSETLSPTMTGRGLGRRLDALTLDLVDLKRAAAAVDGTVNDAFVAAVTGGLRRYHERHGSVVDELRVTMPISIRTENDPAGGNRITLERFNVPVGVADPIERIRQTAGRCLSARRDRALPLSDAIAGVLNLLPSAVIAGMLKHVDFVASNVPGVGVPIYLAGAPVTGYFAFGPTTGSAVNVTLLSHCGQCCVGLTVDTAAIPDHDVLLECFSEGFEEVLALAGEHRPVGSLES